ncbi:hypothetical protein ACNKHO_04405 [Shigella flexneri]
MFLSDASASNLAAPVPVSGVVVAVAGMAKISPFEVVKRTPYRSSSG